MSLLHAILFILAILILPLVGGGIVHQIGRLMVACWRRTRAPRARSRQHRHALAVEQPQDNRFTAIWRWVTIAVIVALAVAVFVRFPKESQLQRDLTALVGYSATRVSVRLTHDTPADRAAVMTALAPVLRDGGRTFVYRSGKRRSGGHSNRAMMPARYRFDAATLEIVMGGILPNDRLAPIHAALTAVAAHRSLDGLEERSAATLQIGGQIYPVTVLPRTARLSGLAYFDPEWEKDQNACHLRIHAEVPPQLSEVVFSARAYDEASDLVSLKIGEEPGAKFSVIRMIATQIWIRRPHVRSVVLSLVPQSFDARSKSCALDFTSFIDVRLVSAAALNAMPGLQGRIAAVQIPQHRMFWPLLNGEFERSAEDERGIAGGKACTYEDRALLRAKIQSIKAGCGNDPASDACAVAEARRTQLAAHLSQCFTRVREGWEFRRN
ncbi:hypothetical protein KZ686_18820 [Cupriavidus cauae]|uniref:hypothetical protein n=1 Tax=Cupriavidus cauae TaxID=2608999 RepID=UPI002242FA2E|nr:hypothetical protein [Cupriavidus cauae]UZN52141.1 hypothetical protein KZ686_18820 [Cupriavidus cauae]